MEKIIIILLPLFYLGSFITRNLMVKATTGQRIRATDPLLTASIVAMSMCFAVVILSTYSPRFYGVMGTLTDLRNPQVAHAGFVLFAVSIVLAWILSGQLGSSWRVGVHTDQENSLVQTGVYRYIRNPYFLSYYLMLIGVFLVRPSLVQAVLIISTVSIFHRMVIKEEIYLLSVHGVAYKDYKASTGRYFPRLTRNQEVFDE